MANPQTENGHLDLANELVEKLAQTQIPGNEMRIIWAIWRKTYCWHKKEDWISYSQFQDITKIGNWSHISRAIKGLIDKNMITKNGNLYGFQKDYQKWQLPKMVTKVTKNGKNGLPKLADTKETLTKETIQKKPAVNGDLTRAISLFGSLNENYERFFKLKQQRDAVARLLAKYGFEKLSRLIGIVLRNRNEEFPLSINTPCQLEDKLQALVNWNNKQAAAQKDNFKGTGINKIKED